MLIRKKIEIAAVLTAAVVFLGACAEKALKMEPVATSESPVEQVSRLDKDIGNARNNQLNVLTPTWFSKAEASLYEAKKGLELEAELSEILRNVAYGRAHLHRAKEVGNLVRTELSGVIKARDLARAAGATNLVGDYAEAEEQFLELTKAIEKNNLRWAQKNRVKVIRTFDELENF